MMRRAYGGASAWILAFLLWWPVPIVVAQAVGSVSIDHQLNATDLETFFDGLMAAHFQAYHIPGASVAVVKDGEILFAKGYGYADLDNGTPVEATKTLFRLGSVSKLFIWTAVMQLVERGLLDLNQDINAYLADTDVRVPPAFSAPITMAHLMNHSAGFEDRNIGLFSRDPESVRPLGEVLATRLPQRVLPPGEVTAYSNYGTALAAYVVEVISGLPWTTYVEENILKPLGMEQATPRQPVPAPLQDNLAVGYYYSPASADYEPQPFEYVPAAPAGAFSATATDAARFMIAHLQLGRLGNGRILKAETAQSMHSASLRQDSRLGGVAHGFLERPYGRLRTMGHGGDAFAFHTELRLVPSHDLGLFVAYNSPDGVMARDQLVRAFFDRYFASYANESVESGDKGARTGEGEGLSQHAGVYRSTRVPRTTLDRMMELLSVTTVRVNRADPTGTSLLVSFGLGKEPLQFRQVDDGVFQEVGATGHIRFVTDQQGQPDRLLMGSVWMSEKMSWYQTPGVQFGIVVACALALLSAVTAWSVAALRQRRRGPDAQCLQRARWLAGVVGALYLIVLVSLVVVLKDPMELAFGVPRGLRFMLGVATLAALLSPVVAVVAVVVWRHRYGSLASRVHYLLVALANVTLALWFNHWNLLGARL
jgi:CubicO group peptidase (beta-lactamase class C family)/uncharacterized integral membrane protein